MRRHREVPDTKIVVFPDNHRGDASPAAHRQTWGPDHDIPPLTAGEVVLVGRGKLIAVCTLYVCLRPGLGFFLRGCRLVQWGSGQRVFLPQRTTRVQMVDAVDQGTVIRDRTYYADLISFDTNRGQKQFEEAALRAVRYAVDQHRNNQREPSAADYGGAVASDVPF